MHTIRWVALLLVSIASVEMSSDRSVAQAGEEALYHFVLSAASGQIDENVITLHNVPVVVFWGHQAEQGAGQISVKDFVSLWQRSGDLKNAPPHATLSILAASSKGQPTVFTVVGMRNVEHDMVLITETLDDVLPTGTFGPASIFFDGVRNDPLNGDHRCPSNCN